MEQSTILLPPTAAAQFLLAFCQGQPLKSLYICPELSLLGQCKSLTSINFGQILVKIVIKIIWNSWTLNSPNEPNKNSTTSKIHIYWDVWHFLFLCQSQSISMQHWKYLTGSKYFRVEAVAVWAEWAVWQVLLSTALFYLSRSIKLYQLLLQPFQSICSCATQELIFYVI